MQKSSGANSNQNIFNSVLDVDSTSANVMTFVLKNSLNKRILTVVKLMAIKTLLL